MTKENQTEMGHSKSLRILMVEDSEDDALLIIRQFKKENYDIISKRVETASQMQTALADASWDLVLSDYSLPEFDAPSALTVLQNAGLDIPFIVISGVIGEETAVALMKAGAHDYIMKNNLARLIPAVNRELSEAQTRRAKQQSDKALIESEAKYRTVVESSLVGVFIVQDGIFSFVNKQWCEMYGYTYDEIVNKVDPLDLIHPEDRDSAKEMVRLRRSGYAVQTEHETRNIRKDGKVIILKVAASEGLYQGRPACFGTVGDITEQRRSEEALRISQLQLLEAMDLAHIVYWDFDPIAQTFVFNDPFYAFYGTTAEQEGGYRMTKEEYASRFIHPEDLPGHYQFVKENTLRPATELFGELEHRIIRRNGEVRHILVRTRVIKDDSGHIVKRYGANQDITERIKADAALIESEERYRTAIEHSHDGIGLIKDGNHIYVNNKLLEIFGYDKPEDVVGKPTALIVHPDCHEELEEFSRREREGKEAPGRFEFKGIKKDGTEVFIDASATPTNYQGEQVLFVFSRDITSRKKAKEELVETAEKLRKSLAGTLQAMARTVEIRDPYTAGHEKKVSALGRSIAQEMGLSKDITNNIRMAGAIHDVGKMSVPAEILSKPTRLLDIEMGLIKIHSQAGYDILKDSGLPYPVAEIVLQHHERLDGSGYPRGLKGDEILLEAQIISIADVVEAMASHRPYRPALGIDMALEEIEKGKGIIYNAEAAEACVRLFREKGFSFE